MFRKYWSINKIIFNSCKRHFSHIFSALSFKDQTSKQASKRDRDSESKIYIFARLAQYQNICRLHNKFSHQIIARVQESMVLNICFQRALSVSWWWNMFAHKHTYKKFPVLFYKTKVIPNLMCKRFILLYYFTFPRATFIPGIFLFFPFAHLFVSLFLFFVQYFENYSDWWTF